MAIGAGDAASFLAEGDLATLDDGVTTAKVHVDHPEKLEQFGGVASRPGMIVEEPTITYETNSAFGKKLARGVGFRVGGVHYTVSAGPRKLDDGLLSMADLNIG